MLAEMRDALKGNGIELELANVRAPALEILRRSGMTDDLGPGGVVATPESAGEIARSG